MTSNIIYHYVYRITNLVENKHYYGKRSTKTLPHLDLGHRYFSSSVDKEFIKDQKENPTNYRYKIIFTFNNANKAVTFEIRLHNKFNVGINPNFYNNAIQTASGFDTTGMVTMKDSDGKYIHLLKNDPIILSRGLVGLSTGKISVKDKDGKNLSVSKDHPKVLSGEYIFISKTKKWISNIELQIEKFIDKDDPIPMGWVVGQKISTKTPKGSRNIYNLELKKNSVLKPGEELSPGWEFGQLNKLGEIKVPPPPRTGTRWCYSLELKQNKCLEVGETIPYGYFYGKKNFNQTSPPIPKGTRRIYNMKLKKNSTIKPGEKLLPGWEYGMKFSWD